VVSPDPDRLPLMSTFYPGPDPLRRALTLALASESMQRPLELSELLSLCQSCVVTGRTLKREGSVEASASSGRPGAAQQPWRLTTPTRPVSPTEANSSPGLLHSMAARPAAPKLVEDPKKNTQKQQNNMLRTAGDGPRGPVTAMKSG